MAPGHDPPVAHRSRLGFVKRFRKDEEGVTAIEFAFVAIPFFALLFAIIEAALVFWTQQVLETAVSDASRRIYTGQFQAENRTITDAADLQTAFKDEICARVVALFDCESTLRVDVRSFGDFDGVTFGSVLDDDGALDDDAFGFQSSGAGQVVVVRAAIDYPVFTTVLDGSGANLPDGRRLIMASAAFRNEPFGN
ncbi:TadE/TadG family type IV pilus assembly protein [Salinarimonas sp. NSM]|uniref:TadE/TadG family type IV pilus assembly protein n=1 Tax=Salinarimonas sp. NSM TaxID=3458003 RepID=UPI00403580A9